MRRDPPRCRGDSLVGPPLRRDVPILGLRAKAGDELAAKLGSGVVTVGDLGQLARADLEAAVGPEWTRQLLELYWGQDHRPVEERGPQKTVISERSFPPMHTWQVCLMGFIRSGSKLRAPSASFRLTLCRRFRETCPC